MVGVRRGGEGELDLRWVVCEVGGTAEQMGCESSRMVVGLCRRRVEWGQGQACCFCAQKIWVVCLLQTPTDESKTTFILTAVWGFCVRV